MRLGVDGRVLDDRYHGIGRITYELLDRLTASPDTDVTIFLNDRPASDRFDIEALTSRPGVRVVTFEPALTSATQYLRWPSALRRSGVDVALFPYHLGAALVGGRRRISVVHDCILETDKRFAPGAGTRALYRMLTAVVVRRTTVLTPSRASAAAVREHYGVAVPDSRVVEWGVRAAAATGRRVAGAGGRLLPDRFYLHVGARRPHKNVPQLIRVLALLPPAEHLVLVGTSDDRWPDPTTAIARELGVGDRVIELPTVSESELAALYRQARGFLYPSMVEGFGLPLLEAMAAGAPVVASDIPVFREVAQQAVLFVPPGDTGGWVRAIRELDDDTRRDALIADGRRLAASRTWQRAADRLASILAAP